MEIKHELDSPPYGAFRAYDENGPIGSMVYVRSGADVIIVQHTGVEPRARGLGVGTHLFEFLVSWARETHTQIVAQFPFTLKAFRKHPEALDVLR